MNKKVYIIFALALVVVVVLSLALSLRNSSGNEIPSDGENTISTGEEKQLDIVDSNVLDSLETDSSLGRINWAEEYANDSEIVRLHDFLDDNDDNNILIQAEFLASSESPARRRSVIPALQWVGSPKAGLILATLLNDENEEISEDAYLALQQVFDEASSSILLDSKTGEFITKYDINDYHDMGVATLLASTSEDRCGMFMTKISTFDVKLALPILLDVLDDGNAEQKQLAKEYIDTVTHGDGVTNREEAILWLMKDQGIDRLDE